MISSLVCNIKPRINQLPRLLLPMDCPTILHQADGRCLPTLLLSAMTTHLERMVLVATSLQCHPSSTTLHFHPNETGMSNSALSILGSISAGRQIRDETQQVVHNFRLVGPADLSRSTGPLATAMLVMMTLDTGKLARTSSPVHLIQVKLNGGLLQIGRTVDRATGIGTATEAVTIKGIIRTTDIKSSMTSTTRSTQINTMVQTTKLRLRVDLCLHKTSQQLSRDLQHLGPVIPCLYVIMGTGRVLMPIESYHLRSMAALVTVHRPSDLVWCLAALNRHLHRSRCRSHRRSSERSLVYSRNLRASNCP